MFPDDDFRDRNDDFFESLRSGLEAAIEHGKLATSATEALIADVPEEKGEAGGLGMGM